MPLPLIGTAISAISGYFSERNAKKREKNQALHEREIALIKSDTDYNHEALRAEGWKDEYLTLILSLPFLTFFTGAIFKLPSLTEGTHEFFVAMSEAPEWYQWAFLGMVAAIFGLKGWTLNKAMGKK